MTDPDTAINSVTLACIVKGMLLREARNAADADAFLREVSAAAHAVAGQIEIEPISEIARTRMDKIIGDVRALLP
jgi:hypothetical protein